MHGLQLKLINYAKQSAQRGITAAILMASLDHSTLH